MEHLELLVGQLAGELGNLEELDNFGNSIILGT